MNIIIVGCSRVGETLAANLGAEENNVTMIDLSSEKINDITSRYDVMGIVGNGATHMTQIEAGIEDADLLIAVTESDELNLLCCTVAKKSANCNTIARVTNPDYNADANFLKEKIGLEMIINPELESANEIARILRFPSAMKIETFAKGKVELLSFKMPEASPLIKMSVMEVVKNFKCDILVCSVERENETFIPNGNFVFEEKDVITIIASPKNVYDFFKKINYKVDAVKNAVIVGGGKITHYLCHILKNSGISLKVIDNNIKNCDELASSFDKVTVINADESNREILVEEGVERTDAFVTATDSDEENILLSLFAKSAGKAKIVTKINQTDYNDIVKHLDLDTTIYPKNVTSDMIVRYVRATKNTLGGNVERLYNIANGKVEAAEFSVNSSSSITNIPLSELKIKKGVIIAAILRNNTVLLPRGSDMILPGDSVITVSKKLPIHDISEIIEKNQSGAEK